ncbi:MAG TPA: hypothetical protein VHL11_15850 [Phototrophicaceae bacterium]|nr:hypothetical protein [Phototrophicaceae bacterium]
MDIKTAVDEFVLSCEADGLKSKTIRWYRSLLTELIKTVVLPLDDVTTHDMVGTSQI